MAESKERTVLHLFKRDSLHSAIGRVSQLRRRRSMGALLLLASLLFTDAAYAAVAPSATATTGTSAPEQIAQGRQLFLVSCAFCHGQNGEGVTSRDGNNIGPSLVGVGAASVDFQLNTKRMPAQAPGPQAIPHKGAKEPLYTPEEIQALDAYVASLGPGPAIPDASITTPTWDEATRERMIQLGGKVFLTNCTACHNFTGAGGAMPNGAIAPSILNDDATTIYEALLSGPGPMDTFSDGNISPTEKAAVIAYVQSQKEQTKFGGFALMSLGPVAEGLMAWVVGIGAMIAFAVWIAAHTSRTNKKKDA